MDSPEFVDYICKKDLTLAQRIWKAIKNLINKLRNINNNDDVKNSIKKLTEFQEMLGDEILKYKSQKNSFIIHTDIKFSMDYDSYPQSTKDVIKGYLENIDTHILNMVENAYDNKLAFERYKLSDVKNKEAKEISKMLGIDVSGYSHNISSNDIIHIINRHGINGKFDKSMKNANDIARVKWVIDNYDKIEDLKDESNRITSNNNQLAKLIKYSKKINGTYYVVEAIAENKYKKIWVTSAYINKKGYITQTSDAKSPETDAQSELASLYPNNTNISQSDNDVKHKARLLIQSKAFKTHIENKG